MSKLILVVALLAMSTKYAQAYLDPGTGSYIIQVVMGGALGGMYLLKVYWKRIGGFIAGLKNKDEKRS